MDFAADMRINPEELDVEWLRQPQLYAKYAQEVSRLKGISDRAKERVEVVRAELDREIRTNPEQYGLSKLTEGALDAAIKAHPSYAEAKVTQFETAEDAAQGFNALGALDHRKAALENLVKLHLAHYFSGPSSPRDLGSLWRERTEERKDDRFRLKLAERKIQRGKPTEND